MVELDVEDVPAPVLDARHALAVCHAGRLQLAAGDDGHLVGDANRERFENRSGGVIAQTLEAILHDDRRVFGGLSTCNPQHV